MRFPFTQISLLSAILFFAAPSRSQSVADCQQASRLHAEAEVLQELFANLWGPAKTAGLPAIGASDESGRVTSMQDLIKNDLADCQSGKISTNACGNYKRIRDASVGPGSGSGPATEMGTNPQNCKIYGAKTVTDENGNTQTGVDSDNEVTLDQAPAGGAARARFLRAFMHEKLHQDNCRALNGPNSNFDPDDWSNPSPYLEKMQDHQKHAAEEIDAYQVSKDELEKYLEENCFDPDLEVDAGDMVGECGDSPSAVAKLKSVAQSAKSWVVNTASDWMSVPAPFPVTTAANGENEVPLRADCQCCNTMNKFGEVRVYGGPGHSILMGKDDANLGCARKEECAGLSGDPHMRTYDGLAYDFQGHGEFVLARGEGFEVQARMQPRNDQPVTVGSAVAIRLSGVRVAMYAGSPVRVTVEGSPITLAKGAEYRLPRGAMIRRDQQFYRLTSSAGLALEVRPGNATLSLRIGFPPGTPSAGLLGNFDGDTANDILSAAGRMLTRPVDFETLYGEFGASWRVSAETSLFDYEPGQSPETIGDVRFPPVSIRARDVGPAERRKAEQVCRAAGVVDEVNLDDCVLDVGLTGDPEFAEIAAEQPPAARRLEVRPPSGERRESTSSEPEKLAAGAAGVTLRAAAQAVASFDIEVEINGGNLSHNLVCISEMGSRDQSRITQISAGEGPADVARTLTLTAPNPPGAYEIRYISRESRWDAQIRIPLEVRAPKAHLEAPATATTGGAVNVKCVGECSPNTLIVVVPAGSPDTTVLHPASMKKGPDVRILRLPKEPGEYEIRYLGHQRPAWVFARKAIRLQ